MPTFRLFVSSPSDAMRERQCVERVAARLNAEFAGAGRLEVVRWETQFYQAFAHLPESDRTVHRLRSVRRHCRHSDLL
jgi:hypothetical protein